ncbi:hypothetical protein [Celeribacter halophilus]|uniref:hypothetical protein n=1 Tax=Celeribacter halophilus TaxID=576117 RepID=UPI003A926172
MSKTEKLTLALAMITAAGAAAADGVTYSKVEASYFNIEEADITSLNGDIDYVTGQLSFTGSADLVSAEGYDISVLRGTAGYAIVPGMTVYALLSVSNEEGGYDDTSYGLGAEYQTGDYGIALEYETYDEADVDSLTLSGFYGFGASTVYGFANDWDDDTSYVLGYKYDATAFEVNVASVWFEGGFDTGLTAIGGEYNATQDFTVLASVVSTNENYLEDGLLTIGGRYALNDSTSLEANYGTAFGDIDGDGFSLALTFETGARRLRVIDQVEDFASDTTPLLDILN